MKNNSMNTKANAPGINALNNESLMNTSGGHPGALIGKHAIAMVAPEAANFGFNRLHQGKLNTIKANHINAMNERNTQTDQVIEKAVSSIQDNQESSQALHRKLDMLSYFAQHS